MKILYPPGKSRHLRADSTAGVEKRLIEKHHLWWMVQMGVEDSAAGQAVEVQQEVTSGRLATSGAPRGQSKSPADPDRPSTAGIRVCSCKHRGNKDESLSWGSYYPSQVPYLSFSLWIESFGTQDYWQLVESKLFMRSLT